MLALRTFPTICAALLVGSASLTACSGNAGGTKSLPVVGANHRAALQRGTAMISFTTKGRPLVPNRAWRLEERPIAEEALQTGHAYPHRESWHYSGIDSSCGKLKWSYDNKIPGVSVTIEPRETSLDGDAEVSFSKIPDDAKFSVYAQQVIGTCTGSDPSGTLPVPTDYTIAVVRLDVGRVAQVSRDPTIVTDKTFDAIVGQFIELKAVADPNVTLRSTTWTPLPGDNNGNVVASYTETKESADVNPFNPSDYLKPMIDFYWVHGSGSPQDLRIDAVFPVHAVHCDPARCTGSEDKWGAADAESKANVLAPAGISLKSKTGQVSVGKDPSVNCTLALHFGVPNGGAKCGAGVQHGIAWSFKATAPAGGGGDLDATQLITRTASATELPGGTSHIQPPQTSGQELDNCVQYGTDDAKHQPVASNNSATWISDDSPFLSLAPGWKTLTNADTFRIYFVYKPSDESGAAKNRSNIWVPLGHLDWDWNGVATNRGTQKAPKWVLTSSGYKRNPTGVAANDPLPTWGQSFPTAETPCPRD